MNRIYRVLLLADSRGFAVQDYVRRFMEGRNHPITVEVHAYSGATINDTVDKGLRDAKLQCYDQVYLLSGVNNLTILRGRRKVDPKYHSWTTMVRDIMIELYEARAKLYTLSTSVIV